MELNKKMSFLTEEWGVAASDFKTLLFVLSKKYQLDSDNVTLICLT